MHRMQRARRKMIEALHDEDTALYAAFLDDRRKAEGESHFVRSSDRYPLCGRGDVNTYAIFAETNRCSSSKLVASVASYRRGLRLMTPQSSSLPI